MSMTAIHLSLFHGVACAHNLLASVMGLRGVNVKEFVPKLVVDRAPFLWIDLSSPSPNLDMKNLLGR
jgi:hypothetical protein